MTPPPGSFRRLFEYTGRQRPRWWSAFATVAGAMFIIQLAARLIPLLPPGPANPSFFDQFLLTLLNPILPTADTARAVALLILMVSLILIGTLILRQGRAALTQLGQDLVVDVRSDYYASLLRQGTQFFRRNESGTLTNIGLNDTEAISAFSITHVPYFVQSGTQFVMVLLFMLTLNVWLALGALAVILLVFFATQAVFVPPTQVLTARYAQKLGQVTSKLNEDMAAVRDIQLFTQEARFAQNFRRELETLAADMRATGRWQASSFAAYQFLESFGPALIYGVGALLVLSGLAEDKVLGSFAVYFSQLALPVLGLSRSMVTIQGLRVACARVFGVMDTPPEIREAPNARDPGQLRGHIRFEDVSFSYAPDDPEAWRLSNINLEILPGEKVALVGGSGTGKSSLLYLLARFVDVTAGRITIDGHDVRELSLHGLRQNLGLVAQNVVLLRGTLMENLRFANPNASPAEVEAAARVGNVDEFLANLENGYETELGEQGRALSGGQRQRVSIARAALSNPTILLLDEATSALDTRTEESVMRALDALTRGRTSLTIAHRLNTIRNADKIVLLGRNAKGQVTVRAVGNHDTLMDTSAEYAELYGRQRRKGILMPIGPLYDTTAALPTVLGLASAYKAPVYLLDFGFMRVEKDEPLERRFGVTIMPTKNDPLVLNAKHMRRVEDIRLKVEAEGLEIQIVKPTDITLDWVQVTLNAIYQTGATHLVAVDNVMVSMETLRESIRLIERKGGVEYILVSPIAEAM